MSCILLFVAFLFLLGYPRCGALHSRCVTLPIERARLYAKASALFDAFSCVRQMAPCETDTFSCVLVVLASSFRPNFADFGALKPTRFVRRARSLQKRARSKRGVILRVWVQTQFETSMCSAWSWPKWSHLERRSYLPFGRSSSLKLVKLCHLKFNMISTNWCECLLLGSRTRGRCMTISFLVSQMYQVIDLQWVTKIRI